MSQKQAAEEEARRGSTMRQLAAQRKESNAERKPGYARSPTTATFLARRRFHKLQKA